MLKSENYWVLGESNAPFVGAYLRKTDQLISANLLRKGFILENIFLELFTQ